MNPSVRVAAAPLFIDNDMVKRRELKRHVVLLYSAGMDSFRGLIVLLCAVKYA